MMVMRLFYKILLNLIKPGLTKRPKELLLILNSVSKQYIYVLGMGVYMAIHTVLDRFFSRKGIN